jgi:DNA repair protein RadC
MSKSIYCIGRKNGGQLEMKICEGRSSKEAAKRISIVTIKLIREGSVLYDVRKISNPADAVELGRRFLEDADREQLLVCCLDTKNQPQAVNVASVGSLNSSIVHPREVFKAAILSNAASILIFHNHPSGDPTPSNEDISITKRLKEAGKIMGIELLDHLIIGGNGKYCSLKEEGML